MDMDYYAEPTLAEFHHDNTFVRGVKGPVGSGKSTAMVMEIMGRATAQVAFRGVRSSRWAVVRNTYRDLKSTTIKTWQDWVDPGIAPVIYDSPIRCNVRWRLHDGTALNLQVEFMALDKEQDVKHLKSLELTGAWINEAKYMPKSILDGITERVRRYPPKNKGGFNWSGVIMDTNPPDDQHWWYHLAEIQRPRGYRFWDQPGALRYDAASGGILVPNQEAENVTNQTAGFDYWLDMAEGKDEQWIKANILGEYAVIIDGRPIWPAFRDSFHTVPHLEVMRGLPLVLGWDFGLEPACAICQVSPRGQFCVLQEVVSTGDTGIRQFVTDCVLPVLQTEYEGMPFDSWGDPAGTQRAQTDEKTCLEILNELGIPTRPAHTNAFVARRDAVDRLLLALRDAEPALLLSTQGAPTLRSAMGGRYQFRRLQTADERYSEGPEKNHWSHIAEALQYAALSIDPSRTSKTSSALPIVPGTNWVS